MTRLILAICPSNQDGNPVEGGGNEMQHVAPLASSILAEAQRHGSIVARLFTATPESGDSPSGSLSGLIAQQRQAATWIVAAREEGDFTVSLNIHSDSGGYRHCGYFFDGAGTVSEWLGKALADAVKSWFAGVVTHADYSAYIFARELHDVACPVLLEMGAHTIPADVAAVEQHGPEIAVELVSTLVGFFGLESAPPLNTGELRAYGEWSLARLANGQDPRDLVAFGEHVRLLGGDPGNLARYGVPSGA